MRLFFSLLVCLSLMSCSVSLTDYSGRSPKLQFTEFFNGKLCAKGLLRTRNGTVSRKFSAEIIATATTNEVLLDEIFLFDDGAIQKRLWRFTKDDDSWEGVAGDVVGVAIAEIMGDTLKLDYQLAISYDNTERVVTMEDWLHMVDEHTLMGSTEMSKWGINVGRIDIVIQKQMNDVYQCINSKSES